MLLSVLYMLASASLALPWLLTCCRIVFLRFFLENGSFLFVGELKGKIYTMVFSNTAQSFPIQWNVYCLIRMTAFKIQLLISGLLSENWLKISTHLVGYDKRNVWYWVSRDQTSVIKMLVCVNSLKIYRKYVFWGGFFVRLFTKLLEPQKVHSLWCYNLNMSFPCRATGLIFFCLLFPCGV